MTNLDKSNKNTRRDRLRLFQKGMQAHMLGLNTITFDGTVHKVSDIISAIDQDIAASDATEKAYAAWLATVAAERASHQALDPLISGTTQVARLQFGNTPAAQGVLGDFGLTPHKKAVTTPATKVAAAGKAKATRALLHTAGPKQKKLAKVQAAKAAAPAPGTAPAQTGSSPAAAPVAGGTTATTPATPSK